MEHPLVVLNFARGLINSLKAFHIQSFNLNKINILKSRWEEGYIIVFMFIDSR